MEIPSARSLVWPVVRALRELGGSGRIDEIDDKVAQLEGFTDEQQQFDGRNGLELPYRLRWARTMAKKRGLVEIVSRGVWALTKDGKEVDQEEVKRRRVMHASDRRRSAMPEGTSVSSEASDEAEVVDVLDGDDDAGQAWQATALVALQAMTPDAFERLCQRLLRQAGFINVAVTGRTGDGGIDGVGTYRMSLVSFPVFFQCKRYVGSVGSSQVRDFRGAMIGRGEKGLLITTGTFTSAARAEATRDGAPPLDLIDGEELVELLREHKLGISTELVEQVTVHPEFFDSI
ncbi:restriction endonuclease [Amycolatopsis sp. CA-126428]|uniref:restriction endonuclease n=1 Tax=Amycolatopsis sp. CA-126428 TaxID=2073158 RepID=UPI0018EE24BB|nr:restriction endonuclease [Amycolatopsis sp. CA-126428]